MAILTNGGGLGIMAVDRLTQLEGVAPALAPELVAKLDAALPPSWSRSNPLDIAGDADAARYLAALDLLLADAENDAVLVLNVETAVASAPAGVWHPSHAALRQHGPHLAVLVELPHAGGVRMVGNFLGQWSRAAN